MSSIELFDSCLNIELFGLHRSDLKAKTALVSKNACNIMQHLANLQKTHAPRYGTTGVVTTVRLSPIYIWALRSRLTCFFGLIAEMMRNIAQSSVEIHWLKLMPSVAFCGNGDMQSFNQSAIKPHARNCGCVHPMNQHVMKGLTQTQTISVYHAGMYIIGSALQR